VRQNSGSTLSAQGAVSDGGILHPELRAAWAAVANAKLIEYRKQCWRVAGLVRQGVISKGHAVDTMYDVAVAHALVRALGHDRVQAILAEAFCDAESEVRSSGRIGLRS
jgi:hypothetical protein